MNREEVERIIKVARESGEQPNLSDANLRDANLRGANLTGANLTGANLSWADLTGANLRGANLTGANLSWANLTGPNLRWANLTGASLRDANLTGANLRGVNLTGADLRDANLTGAAGKFSTGYFGRHHAVAAGGYISIGCERHTCQVWLDDGPKIGRENGYTETEISRYMAWIELAVEWLESDG